MKKIELKNNTIPANIISIDIGLDGAIFKDGISYLMPTVEIILEEPVMVLNLDSKGKKQIIKSGPQKGQFKMKIKRPAKTKRELDVNTIYNLFSSNMKQNQVIVLEQPGNSVGNSSKSSSTTDRNFGKLLALAELSGSSIIIVPAAKWKKALNLPSEKLPCVEFAEKLSGSSFRTERNAILDGQSEAFLIGYWYSLATKESDNKNVKTI